MMATTSMSPRRLPAWKDLEEHIARSPSTLRELFADDPGRATERMTRGRGAWSSTGQRTA